MSVDLDSMTVSPQRVAVAKNSKSGPIAYIKKRKLSLLRLGIQLAFVAFISYVSIRHMVIGGGPTGSPSLHAYCPFGGLETLYKTVTTGAFVKKLRPSNLALFGSMVMLGVFAGRGFCGWICPFGSVTEWLGVLGRKAFPNRIVVPPALDRVLRTVKYFILALVLAGTYYTGRMVFADYDPYPALFHFGVWAEISSAAIIILAITLVASIFIDRAWCRYACPLGAIGAILNKISFLKVKRDVSACKSCRSCSETSCPMGLQVSQMEQTNAECIRCLRCVDGCRPESVKVAS